MRRVVQVGAVPHENRGGRSYLVVNGEAVSYAHVVYSTAGIAPTICCGHFQPLIVYEEDCPAEYL